jgi:hypothetical protein
VNSNINCLFCYFVVFVHQRFSVIENGLFYFGDIFFGQTMDGVV